MEESSVENSEPKRGRKKLERKIQWLTRRKIGGLKMVTNCKRKNRSFLFFVKRKQTLYQKISGQVQECLSKREREREIPVEFRRNRFPLGWISDEKTNLESKEDHFLHECTILDSILLAIPDSCLLDGNLNALNGLPRDTSNWWRLPLLKLEARTPTWKYPLHNGIGFD